MKKVLLSSVAALAVFAAVAPVFANDATAEGVFGANRTTNESGIYADTSKDATVAEIKDANDKDLGTSLKNGLVTLTNLKLEKSLTLIKVKQARKLTLKHQLQVKKLFQKQAQLNNLFI